MIKIENKTTGEVSKVFGVFVNERGAISNCDKGTKKGSKFLSKHPLTLQGVEDEYEIFTLDEGWVLSTKATKDRRKAKAQPKVEDVTSDIPVNEIAEDIVTGIVDIDNVREDLCAKYGQIGADLYDVICTIARNMIPGTTTQQAQGNVEQVTIVTTDNGQGKVKGKTHPAFKGLVTAVKKDTCLYLWGDAGTGKSYLAKQIADALNLDFYPMQQLLFAHQVEGYGNAAGEYVETPFYKAFTQGGVVDLEEIDSSAPEALLVINQALANKRFCFPVVGVKEAHPNFRVIATGNTAMLGGDSEYTGRSPIDASTRDRFLFCHVDYNKEIEDTLTQGDLTISEFIRDVRHAKESAGISLIVSMRAIKMLADKDMQESFIDADLVEGALFKGLSKDEVKIIYEGLQDKESRWAQAVKKLTK